MFWWFFPLSLVFKSLSMKCFFSLKISSLWPHGLYSPWSPPGQKTGVGKPFPSSRDLPTPGIEPRSPALPADSLLSEPPGKPKNTGVGGLSLLQGIFLTQQLNWGLLHCRQFLYQLSYQGSPWISLAFSKLIPERVFNNIHLLFWVTLLKSWDPSYCLYWL